MLVIRFVCALGGRNPCQCTDNDVPVGGCLSQCKFVHSNNPQAGTEWKLTRCHSALRVLPDRKILSNLPEILVTGFNVLIILERSRAFGNHYESRPAVSLGLAIKKVSE